LKKRKGSRGPRRKLTRKPEGRGGGHAGKKIFLVKGLSKGTREWLE